MSRFFSDLYVINSLFSKQTFENEHQPEWLFPADCESRADEENNDGEPCAPSPCGDLYCCWKRWHNLPSRTVPHLLSRTAVVNMLDKSRDRMLDDGETLADEVARCIWSARSTLKGDSAVSVPYYKRCRTNDHVDLWQIFVHHYENLYSKEYLAMFLCMETGALMFSSKSEPQTPRFRLIYTTDDISVLFYLQFKSRGIREEKEEDEEESSNDNFLCNTPDNVDGRRRFLSICAKLRDGQGVFYCGKPLEKFLAARFRFEMENNTALIGYSTKFNEFVNFNSKAAFRSDEFILVYENLQ